MTRRNIASSSFGSIAASVKSIVMSVAMFGSIMPTPLATPTTRAVLPETCAAAILCTVSVVMMPRATDSAFVSRRILGIAAKPARTASIGYWRPMTPVEAINTSFAWQPRAEATPATTSRALAMPVAPVATLAFFEMTTTPRARPPRRCSRETTTLGPAKRLWVNTPAALHVESAATRVKSSDESLMPMLVTCAVNPRGSSTLMKPERSDARGWRAWTPSSARCSRSRSST